MPNAQLEDALGIRSLATTQAPRGAMNATDEEVFKV